MNASALNSEFAIPVLGPCGVDSPLSAAWILDGREDFFVEDGRRILLDPVLRGGKKETRSAPEMPSLEAAGPRRKIYFRPSEVTAAIVTCGGLCPGLNDVIRSLVMTLYYRYGVHNVWGIRNGYQGFREPAQEVPIRVTPEMVDDIHRKGGSFLGTSRGTPKTGEIVDFLERRNINVLFVIGGDGTLRGAYEVSCRARERGLKISVIGIPKTIDNDILVVDRTFGFASAVAAASAVIDIAHNEATSQPNGIGLVKLMGRDSGFIACFAALASNEANFVFIPEVPFTLEGERGFLGHLKARLKAKKHAVIVVAEGAGQELMGPAGTEKDASGNPKYRDIGIFLKDAIHAYFVREGMEVTLKYIDPSYIIRAVEATAADDVYCYMLGKNAVHAAMCGRTEMVVGVVNNHHVHIPMPLMAAGRKKVDPRGALWFSVLENTGQAPGMV